MRIIADQEAVELLTQASDAILKSYWNKWIALSTQLLSKIEHIEKFDFTEKKEEKNPGTTK